VPRASADLDQPVPAVPIRPERPGALGLHLRTAPAAQQPSLHGRLPRQTTESAWEPDWTRVQGHLFDAVARHPVKAV